MPRTTSQREASRQRKRRQRQREAERYRQAAEAVAAYQETLDEHLAPAVMRHPVTTPTGQMIVGSRVIVIDGRPSRALPISRQDQIKLLGRSARITDRYIRAARRFQQDWADVGAGVNATGMDYTQERGFSGGAGPGAVMLAQIDARVRLEGAWTYLGGCGVCVRRVVIDGIPPNAYAEETTTTVGYVMELLIHGLTRLANFYWPPAPAKPQEILSFGPPRKFYSTDVDSVTGLVG